MTAGAPASPAFEAGERTPTVSIVDSDEGFASLEREWEALHARAVQASVFTSWPWQYNWWKVYGKTGELRLAVAREGTTLVGLLPLHLETLTVLGSFTVRLLRFVGTGGDTFPDDLGPVVAPGREAAVAAALSDWLLESCADWDAFLLTDLDPGSPFVASLDHACRRAGLRTSRGRSVKIAFIRLPASWEEFLSGLHRDRRYRIRNARKKLEERFSVRHFSWLDPATLDQAVDRLTELHRRRWAAAGGQSHSFASAAYVAFHRAVMHACLKRDWLRLYCLAVDEELIAMYYFYRFRNRVYLMQGGFDPEFASHQPGHVLMGRAIQLAIEEGNEILDFLRGDHRYKEELANGWREAVFLAAYRPTPSGLAYRVSHEQLPALKLAAKGWLARLGLYKEPEQRHR